MTQNDVNNKNDIGPFSLLYMGKIGGNHRFFINKGLINPTWDIGNVYLSIQKKGIDGGILSLNKLQNEKLEPVETIGIYSDKDNEVFLKKFSYPLDSYIDINETSSIYLRIPKTPAGQLIQGAQQFVRNAVINAYLTGGLSNLISNESIVKTEINVNDGLYMRSHDPLSTFNGDIGGEQDSSGAIYLKIAEVTINGDEDIVVTKYLNSHVVFPNVISYADPIIHRGVFAVFGYTYNEQPEEDEEVTRVGYSQYVSPLWLLKPKSDIQDLVVDEIESKYKGEYAARLLNLTEQQANSVSIKEILFFYRKGADKAWRIKSLKSNFDDTYTFEFSLEAEYKQRFQSQFD